MPGSHCSVLGCHNGTGGLNKWKEEFCTVHECNKGTSRCTCDPPFRLIPFPTERKDAKRRAEWIKLINRKDTDWAPDCNCRVCSVHFVDGEPSDSFPNPTLNLGYPETPPKKAKKRPPQKPCIDSVQASKQQELNVQSPSPEDTENHDQSNEDASETSSTHLGTNTEVHMDHTYSKTYKCDCLTNCKCHTIKRLRNRIRQLQNQLKCLGKEPQNDCGSTSLGGIRANANKKRRFTNRFLSDDRSVKLNTGLPNKETFDNLLEVLTPRAEKMRYWGGAKSVISVKVRKCAGSPQKSGRERTLSIKAEFLLVLMKLRQGLTNDFLANLFSISSSMCSTIITTWIKFLGVQLRGLVFWPDKNSISTMLPATLVDNYPNFRCILYCSETFIEKKPNSLKYLVGIAPNGHISFMSRAWGGHLTDRQIVLQSGFLDLLDPNDLIMADREFPIEEDLLCKKATLVIPPPSSGLEQNVAQIKKVANIRIHIERAINRLKLFHILSTTLPVVLAQLFDDILIICAALCNMLPPLIV